MPTLWQLTVLQLGNVGFQIVSRKFAGMRIGFSMKHEYGTRDGTEEFRVNPLRLKAQHVRPRLFMCYSVNAHWFGDTVFNVVAAESLHCSSFFCEAAIGILLTTELLEQRESFRRHPG